MNIDEIIKQVARLHNTERTGDGSLSQSKDRGDGSLSQSNETGHHHIHFVEVMVSFCH